MEESLSGTPKIKRLESQIIYKVFGSEKTTGPIKRHDIAEILLKLALNTNQSIN